MFATAPGSRSTVRVVVADGHPVMLSAIAAELRRAGFNLVGTATSSERILTLVEETQPDVAVLDAAMLAMTGKNLAAVCAATRVVIFTGSDGHTVLDQGIEPGALAYISKTQPLGALVDVVDTVAAGRSWVDPAVAPILVAKVAADGDVLTPRERQVLALVADGCSYQEISERLAIAVSTVQQHVTSAMQGLAADTRTQAVALALRSFMID
ncbi:MAG: response regulator transcription factor [Actinobacteria bacterium]|nr:response regulator transcription factor [Actinomycetota bacterium]